MKKILYVLFGFCMAFCAISCNEEEDNAGDNISGNWNYQSPYFVFEYAQDSISIVMDRGRKTSIAVEEVKNIFLRMAGEKMGDYFKGLTFDADNQLTIKMQMSDQSENTLHATWLKTSEFIQVTLDSTELKKMTNGAVSKIPSISFNYKMDVKGLQMYFDKDYITIIYAMMGDMLMNKVLLPAMGMDPAQAPEAMKQMVEQQIQGILAQIKRLEIGFNLSRP